MKCKASILYIDIIAVRRRKRNRKVMLNVNLKFLMTGNVRNLFSFYNFNPEKKKKNTNSNNEVLSEPKVFLSSTIN